MHAMKPFLHLSKLIIAYLFCLYQSVSYVFALPSQGIDRVFIVVSLLTKFYCKLLYLVLSLGDSVFEPLILSLSLLQRSQMGSFQGLQLLEVVIL